jgi:urease accessory protein
VRKKYPSKPDINHYTNPSKHNISYIMAHSHSHSHDGGIGHSHDDPFNGHGHSHEILDGPGSYANREMPLIEGRDWKDRAFTVGIGG